MNYDYDQFARKLNRNGWEKDPSYSNNDFVIFRRKGKEKSEHPIIIQRRNLSQVLVNNIIKRYNLK